MKTITKATPPEQMIAALMEAIRSAGMPTSSTSYDSAESWMTKSLIHPAAQLRAMRPVKPYTCAQCGRGFAASDERAQYCSNRCRQAAKYARLKAEKDR